MQHRTDANHEATGSGRFARLRRPARLATLATALALIVAGAAGAAFINLPADGSQVNNDPANGHRPGAGRRRLRRRGRHRRRRQLQVPWATFEQRTGGAQQIFVRAFKSGQWVTEGFPASLNIDPTEEAEGPSIDFAGAGRTVPWVRWYEPNANLAGSKTQIFASRFTRPANVWLPSGQDRAPGHAGAVAQHQHRP